LAIPTILVTAYPDEVVRDQALKYRVACYLRKPVVDDRPERCLRSATASYADRRKLTRLLEPSAG
jgi:response regulator RpfG family c-di-GMP phosphodiesterase